jgi:hypothetical protein
MWHILSLLSFLLISSGVAQADITNFSGKWKIISCTPNLPCSGSIDIRQSEVGIAIEGAISLPHEQRMFFLPKLNISGSDLLDPEYGGKIAGSISADGFVHQPIGYKKFVVKRLTSGKISFESSDNNSPTITGFAEKVQ